MQYGPLADRAMSTYALSIGTSYAFEAIEQGPRDPYDAARDAPELVDMSRVDELWVNLLTLARNMFSAVKRSDFDSVTAEEFGEALLFETGIIRELMKNYPWVTLRFYSCNYRDMKKKYPHARVRGDSTPLQKYHTEILSKTITAYYKRVPVKDRLHFDHAIKAVEFKRAVIISNYAYDLLSQKGFRELKLLESHTGKLKDRSLWYTKFEDKDTVRIPMTRVMLQVFGDKNTFFQHDQKIRASIKQLAEEYQWTFATTDDRVAICLGFMKDAYSAQILRSMR
jgi:hypothetical protein